MNLHVLFNICLVRLVIYPPCCLSSQFKLRHPSSVIHFFLSVRCKDISSELTSLIGNFEPINPSSTMSVNITKLFRSAEETEKPEVAAVQGKLPVWVNGTYYRVGPAKFDFKDFTMNHMLDGYAMVAKFEITPEKVTLEKKFIQSDSYKRAIAAQRPVITEFGTPACSDPNKSLFSKFVTALMPEFSDNDYSTLFKIGPDLFSTCDTCYFRQVDTKALGNSPAKYDSNKLFGINGQSAHPLTDSNGDVWNIGFTFFPGLKYQVVKIPNGKSSKEMVKQSKIVATIPSRWNGALGTLHSFGLSENHVIFIEQPMVVSVSKLFAALVKKTSVRDWLEWKGEDKNRFVILTKEGKVNKTEFISKDSFYFMHTINSFEEEGQIVLDIITYATAGVLDMWWLENLRDNVVKPSDFPEYQRFVIPLVEDIKKVPEGENLVKCYSLDHKATAVRQGSRIILTPEIIYEEKGLEYPCINEDYRCKKHSFTYVAGTINENSFRNKICKVNSETKEMVQFKENDHVFPGEPVFIPKPKGKEEDDGVIVSAMTDSRDGHQDFLLFLDKDMKEMARVNFENQIPYALHGIFMQDC